MRDFTQEEKELIVNTPIDRTCFEIGEPMAGLVGGEKVMFILDRAEDYVFSFLEAVRKEYKKQGMLHGHSRQPAPCRLVAGYRTGGAHEGAEICRSHT